MERHIRYPAFCYGPEEEVGIFQQHANSEAQGLTNRSIFYCHQNYYEWISKKTKTFGSTESNVTFSCCDSRYWSSLSFLWMLTIYLKIQEILVVNFHLGWRYSISPKKLLFPLRHIWLYENKRAETVVEDAKRLNGKETSIWNVPTRKLFCGQ